MVAYKKVKIIQNQHCSSKAACYYYWVWLKIGCLLKHLPQIPPILRPHLVHSKVTSNASSQEDKWPWRIVHLHLQHASMTMRKQSTMTKVTDEHCINLLQLPKQNTTDWAQPFWMWEVWNQGVRAGFSWGLSPWPMDSSHCVFTCHLTLCVCPSHIVLCPSSVTSLKDPIFKFSCILKS